jgi:hypothetical protein
MEENKNVLRYENYDWEDCEAMPISMYKKEDREDIKMNCYKIVTGLNTYYVTAWTMANAILRFSQRDYMFSEICEGEQEKFSIEKVDELKAYRSNEMEVIINQLDVNNYVAVGSAEYRSIMSEL